MLSNKKKKSLVVGHEIHVVKETIIARDVKSECTQIYSQGHAYEFCPRLFNTPYDKYLTCCQ